MTGMVAKLSARAPRYQRRDTGDRKKKLAEARF